MSYSRRHRRENVEQSDDAQSEGQMSPRENGECNEGEPSDEESYEDNADAKEAELDGHIAELLAYQMPKPRNIPLQFSPPHTYTQTIDLISRDIAGAEKSITQQVEYLTEAASQAEEFEMTAEVKKIEDSVKALIDQLHLVQEYRTNFNKLKSALIQANGEPIEGSLMSALDAAISAENTSYREKSNHFKYNKSPIYKDFKQLIWEVNHPEEIMPPFSDDDASEDDIVVARQVENFKCPLTATWYEDPVTSKSCNHTFSKDAIMDMIRSSHNGTVDCPVTGCNKRLSSQVLAPNNVLMRKLERARALQNKKAQKLKDARENVTVLES